MRRQFLPPCARVLVILVALIVLLVLLLVLVGTDGLRDVVIVVRVWFVDLVVALVDLGLP